MAPKDLPWFRFYSEARKDLKIRKAARIAGVSFLEAFGFWAAVLSLANDSPERGKLLVTLQERFTIEDVTIECNADETTVQKLMDAFIQFCMIDRLEDGTYVLPNWNKRQFVSDSSTNRVRKYRMEHPSNVSVTPSESDTETDTNNNSADKSANEKPSRKRDERLNHPAILLIKGVTGKYPPKGSFDFVIKRLGASPDGKKFAGVHEAWTARGFNPTNLEGQLNWYRDGIPPGKVNGVNGTAKNGSHKRVLTGANGEKIEVEE